MSDEAQFDDGFVVEVHDSCTSPLTYWGLPKEFLIVWSAVGVAMGLGFHSWWYVWMVIVPGFYVFKKIAEKEPYWFEFVRLFFWGKPARLEV